MPLTPAGWVKLATRFPPTFCGCGSRLIEAVAGVWFGPKKAKTLRLETPVWYGSAASAALPVLLVVANQVCRQLAMAAMTEMFSPAVVEPPLLVAVSV